MSEILRVLLAEFKGIACFADLFSQVTMSMNRQHYSGVEFHLYLCVLDVDH